MLYDKETIKNECISVVIYNTGSNVWYDTMRYYNKLRNMIK